MGIIFEEVEINGKKIKVKVDTGSDFPLCLKKEIINKLKLPLSPLKAKIFREDGTERTEVFENVWTARIKIRGCEFGVPQHVIEAHGDNLLGHPILQALGAKVDEAEEKVVFDMDKCPTGSVGGPTGEVIRE